MKKCKVYSDKTKIDGIIVDNRVLIPAPRATDTEPFYVADGQSYYPPYYAVKEAASLHFGLMPFSTLCKWGEYGEKDSPNRNIMNYYGCDRHRRKSGYCDVKTGLVKIPPEFKHCNPFNEYGAAIVSAELYWVMNTKGEVSNYVCHDIKESHHGVFIIHDMNACGCGVITYEGDELVEPNWYDIEWDGMGGFTVMHITNYEDNTIAFGIADEFGTKVLGLDCRPELYHFPPEKRRINIDRTADFYRERFRLLRKKGKFGLLRDVQVEKYNPTNTYSELILEPEYKYEELPDAAYKVWVAEEIRYFTRLLSVTPKKLPGREGDYWDNVPEDIREDVRKQMMKDGIVQPETVADIVG